MIPITVKCYAGYRGEETPRMVLIGQRQISVKTILDRWLAPDHRYFKFKDPAGSVYLIRHDVIKSSWELIYYDGTSKPAT